MKIPGLSQLQVEPQLQLASGAILGSRQTIELDQSNPISDIFVHVDLSFSTKPTSYSTFGTIAKLDALANVLKRVQLTANDGQSNGNVVDISGVGLLELAIRRGIPISRGTHEVLKYVQLGASTAYGADNDKFRLTYHIPMVHPKITENLRTRCLFPAHLLQDKAQLILDFESVTNMFTSGAIGTALCSVQVVRRRMPQAMTKAIQAKGGFIKWDLLETPKAVAQAQKGYEFNIPTGGTYTDMMLRSYLLASSVYTRDTLDDDTTFGKETRWKIDLAGSTWHQFRWNTMASRNEIMSVEQLYGQPVIAGTAVYLGAGSGAYGTGVDLRNVIADPTAYPILGACGNGAQTAHYPQPGNIYFDFLGESDAESWELGSALDTNDIAKAGTKASVIGDVTTGQVNIIGHRLYGDLTAFQNQDI